MKIVYLIGFTLCLIILLSWSCGASASNDTARKALLDKGTPYKPNSVRAIDGDSLRLDDVLVRISNLDTPERGGRAECDAERFLAAIASKKAENLVNTDGLVVYPVGRDDKFRRPLVRVLINDKDWAKIMISENLAVPWAGKTHDWCGPMKK